MNQKNVIGIILTALLLTVVSLTSCNSDGASYNSNVSSNESVNSPDDAQIDLSDVKSPTNDAESDALIEALRIQYYGEEDTHKMWINMHLSLDSNTTETSKMLRDIYKNGTKETSMLSCLYIPLQDCFNENGLSSIKSVDYSDLPDIYEHIKANDATDRDIGLYITYDMLGLNQVVSDMNESKQTFMNFCLCKRVGGDTDFEMICNAAFYNNLCKIKTELAENDTSAIISNSQKYGYLVLPVLRDSALNGDNESIAVVQKIMKKTASDERFISKSSVSDWLNANSDIIGSIQYIIEN